VWSPRMVPLNPLEWSCLRNFPSSWFATPHDRDETLPPLGNFLRTPLHVWLRLMCWAHEWRRYSYNAIAIEFHGRLQQNRISFPKRSAPNSVGQVRKYFSTSAVEDKALSKHNQSFQNVELALVRLQFRKQSMTFCFLSTFILRPLDLKIIQIAHRYKLPPTYKPPSDFKNTFFHPKLKI